MYSFEIADLAVQILMSVKVKSEVYTRTRHEGAEGE
jgi:hypothetical protein